MATPEELERLRHVHTEHLGIYHCGQTPEEMYSAGREHGKAPLTIGRELNLAATRFKNKNIHCRGEKISERFKKGANLAFKMHNQLRNRMR